METSHQKKLQIRQTEILLSLEKYFFKYLAIVCSKQNLNVSSIDSFNTNYENVSNTHEFFIRYIFGYTKIFFFDTGNNVMDGVEFLEIDSIPSFSSCQQNRQDAMKFLMGFSAYKYSADGDFEQNVPSLKINDFFTQKKTSELFCTDYKLQNNIEIGFFVYVFTSYVRNLIYNSIVEAEQKLRDSTKKVAMFIVKNRNVEISILWRQILILNLMIQIGRYINSGSELETFLLEKNHLQIRFDQLNKTYDINNPSDNFIEVLNQLEEIEIENENIDITQYAKNPQIAASQLTLIDMIDYTLNLIIENIKNGTVTENQFKTFRVLGTRLPDFNNLLIAAQRIINQNIPSQISPQIQFFGRNEAVPMNFMDVEGAENPESEGNRFASDVTKMRKKMNKKQFYSEPKHYAKYSASPKKEHSKWQYYNDRIDSSSDEDD